MAAQAQIIESAGRLRVAVCGLWSNPAKACWYGVYAGRPYKDAWRLKTERTDNGSQYSGGRPTRAEVPQAPIAGT